MYFYSFLFHFYEDFDRERSLKFICDQLTLFRFFIKSMKGPSFQLKDSFKKVAVIHSNMSRIVFMK